MENNPLHPRVGIGVLVICEGKVLLLKRKGSHGSGMWCLGGGHLEFGETVAECARREVREETGLEISGVEIICVNEELDFVKTDNKHYITIGCLAKSGTERVTNIEPHKHSQVGWFKLSDLPDPLFPPSRNIINCYKNAKITNR